MFNKESITCAVSVFVMIVVLYLVLDLFLSRFLNPLVIIIILAVIGFINGYIFGNEIKLSVIIMIILEEIYVFYLIVDFFVFNSGATSSAPALKVQALEVVAVSFILLVFGFLLSIAISMILYIPAYYAVKIKNRNPESV